MIGKTDPPTNSKTIDSLKAHSLKTTPTETLAIDLTSNQTN
jgi:hypothetical protein